MYNSAGAFQRDEPVSLHSPNQWQYQSSFNGTEQTFYMTVSNMQTTYQATGQILDTTFTVTITKPDNTTFTGTWSSANDRIDFGPTYWQPQNLIVAPTGT